MMSPKILVKKSVMEVIPEDLKADLRKVSSVEVILGHTFRVWHNGRTAKDYWVRILRNIYLGTYLVGMYA